MMRYTMEQLIKQLYSHHYTCIIKQEKRIYTSQKRGIAPLIQFLTDGYLEKAIVADKVIGKAAAFLLINANVQEVYADVISEHALSLLNAYHIKVTHKNCTPFIANRSQDGMCPMEESVLHINDPHKALIIIKQKLAKLIQNL